MNKVFLITGGNIGDRKNNLELAAKSIEKNIGHIVKSSSIYETEAWGNTDQDSFYNQVHLVETEWAAKEIMNKILQIEEQMGRIRTIKNAARIIDIDILFVNDEIINNPIVTIPHKEINNRRFVLMPLQEIAPDFIHPVLKVTISKLLSMCKDPLKVIQL
jgi:2-amino-4-hydroxy-6-hydroxymethyldihydropteridine diphosphokinase